MRSNPVFFHSRFIQKAPPTCLTTTLLLQVMIAMLILTKVGGAEPVRVFPSNPHYFQFNGKPLVFVTSDHHYGAVIDRDFDYVRFLDTLAAHGMNLTRIYPGGMFEAPDKYLPGNPLGPSPGRQILPWAKSNQTGANPALAEIGSPSYKYDLDRWDPDYFARLKDFVKQAGKRDIVVEVAFFNGMYFDCWPIMPLYHRNNIQQVGKYEADECGLFTTADQRNKEVIQHQQAYISKITRELNEFDNLIFDLCDEPSLQGLADGGVKNLPDAQVIPWLQAMKEAFLKTETSLPKKHLLGQTVQNLSPDFSNEAWCDWLPAEYVAPALKAIEKDYHVNRPIVDVESDYYGFGLAKPYTVEDVRVEGWWFILGGGAGFINLNGEYRRGQESGGSDTLKSILPQKRVLKDFINRLDLTALSRFTDFSGLPPNAFASAITEPGKQYALYLFHGRDDGKWGAHFSATPGTYRDTLVLKGVPSGTYQAEWLEPATGAVKEKKELRWPGGDLTLSTPEYSLDIALRMHSK
jgi:hypothetical protein